MVVTVPDNLVTPTVCAKWGLKRLLVDVVWDAESTYREKGGPGEFMRDVFPGPNLAIKCATYRRSNDGGKSRLYGTPIARKPLKYRVDEVLDIRFLRHANSAHVLQTLWRGLKCQTFQLPPDLLIQGADPDVVYALSCHRTFPRSVKI